jgi:hypothetical protein
MYSFDEEAICVDVRGLKPSERQTRLKIDNAVNM